APAYEYQWKVTIEFWKEFAQFAKSHGIEQIAIEEFPGTMVWSAETMLKLREATDPIIGINLDPSHMLALGADPIAAARVLKDCLFHIHGKDVRIERGVSNINGILEPKSVTDVAGRAWNYVAVGCGKDLQWWKEFFSVLSMLGYDGDVSLEMEDLTMSIEAGVLTSIDALQQTISK
ncbi:MAG: sugar phosphate isomerase/epimerase family protein, partial [Anaerotignaceae bacterium]